MSLVVSKKHLLLNQIERFTLPTSAEEVWCFFHPTSTSQHQKLSCSSRVCCYVWKHFNYDNKKSAAARHTHAICGTCACWGDRTCDHTWWKNNFVLRNLALKRIDRPEHYFCAVLTLVHSPHLRSGWKTSAGVASLMWHALKIQFESHWQWTGKNDMHHSWCLLRIWCLK